MNAKEKLMRGLTYFITLSGLISVPIVANLTKILPASKGTG